MNKKFEAISSIFEKKSKGKMNSNNGDQRTYLARYFWSIVVLISLIFLISLMLPRGKSYKYTDLKEGEVYVGEEIIAPFTFAINKTENEYKRDLKRAQDEVFSVFVRSDSICEYHLEKIKTFFDSLEAIASHKTQSVLKIKEIASLLQLNNINSSDEILRHLIKETKEKTSADFEKNLIRVARDVCSFGILNQNKNEIKKVDNKILIITDVEELIEDINT